MKALSRALALGLLVFACLAALWTARVMAAGPKGGAGPGTSRSSGATTAFTVTANQNVVVPLTGQSSCSVTVSSVTGTLNVQGSSDNGKTYQLVGAIGGGAITTTGVYAGDVATYALTQLEVVAAASSSATGFITCSSVVSPYAITAPIAIAFSGLQGTYVGGNNTGGQWSNWLTWTGCPPHTGFTAQYMNNGAASWSSLDDILYLIGQWPAGTPMIWSIFPFPANDGVSNLAGAAAGTYNSYYTTWANEILNNANPTSDGYYYIRPMLEVPASTNSYSVQCKASPSNCIAAWDNIATAFHAVSTKFKMVWDTYPVYNDGTNHDIYYPGNSYADLVAQDVYPPTNLGSQINNWNYVLNVSNGLTWLQGESSTHGKPMAMFEWGLQSSQQGPLVAYFYNWFNSNNYVLQSYYDAGTEQLDNLQYFPVDPTFIASWCASTSSTAPTPSPAPTAAPTPTPAPTATPSPGPVISEQPLQCVFSACGSGVPNFSFNLTTLGPADWNAWGYETIGTRDQLSGANLLGNYSVVGGITFANNTTNANGVIWTASGTPTASLGAYTYTNIAAPITAANQGATITAPADTNQRTLMWNVVDYCAAPVLTYQLQNSSGQIIAGPYTDNSVQLQSSGNYLAVITYTGTQTGQSLVVTWQSSVSFCGNNAQIGLGFSTLNLGSPEPIPSPTPASTPTPAILVQSGSGNNQYQSSVTCTFGSAPSNGDKLFAATIHNANSITWTPPSGWNALDSLNSSQGLSTETWYKDAGASEPTTYTWTNSSGNAGSDGVACLEYKNTVTGSGGIDGHTVSAYGTTSTMAATPTQASDQPLAFFLNASNSGSTQTTWTNLTANWTAEVTKNATSNIPVYVAAQQNTVTTDTITPIQPSDTSSTHTSAQTNYLILIKSAIAATPSPAPTAAPNSTIESSACVLPSSTCAITYTPYYNLTLLGGAAWSKWGYESAGAADTYTDGVTTIYNNAGPPYVTGTPVLDMVTAANGNANATTWSNGTPTALAGYAATLNDAQNSAVNITATGQGPIIYATASSLQRTLLINFDQYCIAPVFTWALYTGTPASPTMIYGPFTDTTYQTDNAGNYLVTITYSSGTASLIGVSMTSGSGYCSGNTNAAAGVTAATVNYGSPPPIPTPSPAPTPVVTPTPSAQVTPIFSMGQVTATVPPNPPLSSSSSAKAAYYAAFYTTNAGGTPTGWPFGIHQISNVTYSGGIATHAGYSIAPIYFSSSSDPSVSIACTVNPNYGCMSTSSRNACGKNACSTFHHSGTYYPVNNIHIPKHAFSEGPTPNCSGDCHMIVVDTTFSPPIACTMYQVQQDPPVAGYTTGYQFNIGAGECNQITQTGFPQSTGIAMDLQATQFTVRAVEFNSGRINHAMASPVNCANNPVVTPGNNASTDEPCNSSGYGSGYYHASCQSNTSTACPQYGDHIWLDCTDAEIAALPNPAAGGDTFCSSNWNGGAGTNGPDAATKIFLTALHDYGSFVSDTGYGDNNLGFQINVDDDVASVVLGYPAPWAAVMASEGFSADGSGRYYWTLSNSTQGGKPGASWYAAHIKILAPGT